MKNLFCVLALASIALVSCKKDDEVVVNNKFAGTWKWDTEEFYENNVLTGSMELENATITFDNCPFGEFCTGKSRLLGMSDNIKYKISTDETTIIVDYDGDLSTTEDQTFNTIDIITATEFIFSSTTQTINGMGETVTSKDVMKLSK